MSARFVTDRLDFAYPNGPTVISEVTLAIDQHEFFALIGPNGSGKSTLLKLLLGVLRPTRGSARFEGRETAAFDRREIARRIGVVAQIEELLFPFTTRELVAMGRYPHLGPWQREGARDLAAIESAMLRCDVAHLADRLVQQLSGGERQRVRVARALAQEPDTLVLDEPTSALDLGHEMSVFELLEDLRRERGITVVAATHNINLASRFASRLLLMHQGRALAVGAPEQVLSQDNLQATYGWPVLIVPHPGPGPDTGAPQLIPLSTRKNTP